MRYQAVIFASMFIGYMTYMYDRRTFTYAFPALIDEGFDKNQLGLIVSSQTTAYAISKFLGGVLSDQISARILFSFGIFLSGVAVLCLPFFSTVGIFAALWFLCGLAQGCGWPACAKILRQWYLPSQFGTWWSVLSTSSNLSGSIAPLVAAYIIVHYGWRTSLIIPGVFSLGLAVVCLVTLVNRPSDVGLENIVDDEGKKAKSEKDGDEKASDSTWKDLIKSPFLWLLSIGYLIVFASKTAACDWGQLFIIQELGGSQYQGSAFISSVETGGVVGSFLAGFITDWLIRRKKQSGSLSESNPRMIGILAFVVVTAGLFHFLVFFVNGQSSEVTITFAAFGLGLCLYGAICIFGVVATESAPVHLSGTSHAVVALAANVGAMSAGLPLTYVAKYYNWSGAFLAMEVLNIGLAVLVFFTLGMSSVMVQQTAVKKKQ